MKFCIVTGNLTARHREIFRKNDLFVGMRLPEARELDPLEKRYPRVGAIVMDIIKVPRDVVIPAINIYTYSVV